MKLASKLHRTSLLGVVAKRCVTTARIDVPAKSHVTEKSHILGSGFKKSSPITLHATLVNEPEGFNFQSHAHIHTDSEGCFDLAKAESVGGTYKGVDQMGLFWSMEAQPGSINRVQLNNGLSPLHYTFKIFSDHINDFNVVSPLCTAPLTRYLADQDTTIRTLLSDGLPFNGTLMIPEGDGPFPAVITIKGGNKRKQVVEDAAAILCSQGFITLAMPFYGVAGMPASYQTQPIDVGYFEEAINWLRAHPKVDGEKIGVYGYSMGGTVALGMMSHLPTLKAVCWVSGHIGSILVETVYKDKLTPEALMYVDKIEQHESREDTIIVKHVNTPEPADYDAFLASQHKFEFSDADLLMIYAGDDYSVDTKFMVTLAEKKMKDAGKKNFQIIEYPNMGHICAHAPFSPNVYTVHHPLVPRELKVYYGGLKNKRSHAYDVAKQWDDIIHFFSCKLKKLARL